MKQIKQLSLNEVAILLILGGLIAYFVWSEFFGKPPCSDVAETGDRAATIRCLEDYREYRDGRDPPPYG